MKKQCMADSEETDWWAGQVGVHGARVDPPVSFQCVIELSADTVRVRLLRGRRAWTGEADADSLAPPSIDPRRRAASIRGQGSRIDRVRTAIEDARETGWSADAGGIAVRLLTAEVEDVEAVVFAGKVQGPTAGRFISVVYAIVGVRLCQGVAEFLRCATSRLAMTKIELERLKRKVEVAKLEARGLDHALNIINSQSDYTKDQDAIRNRYAEALCSSLNEYKAKVNDRK